MSTTEQDLFFLLPPELIEAIVDYLDFTDGLNLSHCNRRLYKIIGQHHNYWQRHINEVAQFSRRDIISLSLDRRSDFSAKEVFLLYRRLRQCWRMGDFSEKQCSITQAKLVRMYLDFCILVHFCHESKICQLTWCSQATGLVTRSLQLDHEHLYAVKDVCAITQCCVALYFVNESESNENHSQGVRTMVCIGLTSEAATLNWINSFPSPISGNNTLMESYGGKLFLLCYGDTHYKFEEVLIDTGERNEILMIPKLPNRSLEIRKGSNIVENDDEEEVKLTKWLILDHYSQLPDPDREMYLINTDTSQVEYVVKLTEFKDCEFLFLGNNVLLLPFGSSQDTTKAQVRQLPELKLLYEFPWTWGYPECDCRKIHYFYDTDSEVLHRFSNRAQNHLEMPFKDFGPFSSNLYIEDTMLGEYPDFAPGQLTFFQLPLQPTLNPIKHSIPLKEKLSPDEGHDLWSIGSLSASIIVIINISCLDEEGYQTYGDEYRIFLLKPNI